MDGIAVAAGAGMDADLLALLGGEVARTRLFELDEMRQQPRARPRVARILTGRQATLGEVDRHARGARLKRLADVSHALLDDVLLKLLAGVAGHRVLQRILQPSRPIRW